jgi:hypothetical protein
MHESIQLPTVELFGLGGERNVRFREATSGRENEESSADAGEEKAFFAKRNGMVWLASQSRDRITERTISPFFRHHSRVWWTSADS